MNIVSSLAFCFAYLFICLMHLALLASYLIQDLIVNFLIPLDVNICLVYGFSIIIFGGSGFFLP